MSDLIDRQELIYSLECLPFYHEFWKAEGCEGLWESEAVVNRIKNMSSAEPEPLTDKEQRIFLAAMKREEKVCKQVDAECRDCREPYEDSLVKTCHEIIRKVKGALWT